MMTRTEIEAKLNGIENKEALIAQINNAEDDEAVLEILKQNVLELTEDEARALTIPEDEPDENALDGVADGCKCRGPSEARSCQLHFLDLRPRRNGFRMC